MNEDNDNDTIEIEVSVSIGLVGCRNTVIIEEDREEWEEMEDEEKEEVCRDQMFNMIDWNWEELN